MTTFKSTLIVAATSAMTVGYIGDDEILSALVGKSQAA